MGNTVQLAISLLLALTERLAAISQIISEATLAGRTDLTPEELKVILSADDAAREALVTALGQKPAPPTGPAGMSG